MLVDVFVVKKKKDIYIPINANMAHNMICRATESFVGLNPI